MSPLMWSEVSMSALRAFLLFLLGCAGLAAVDAYPIRAVEVATGLSKPVAIAVVPGRPGELFVVEQHEARIRRVVLATGSVTTFLDLPNGDINTGGEQGLLGLAFHPDYASNGHLFVYLTTDKTLVGQNSGGSSSNLITGNHTEVLRFTASNPLTATTADLASRRVVLYFAQPQTNHNGGCVVFDRDGMLLVSSGDGGGQDDQHGTIGSGQDRTVYLGKILRLDVDGDDYTQDTAAHANRNYAIPADNPYVGSTQFLPEIFAFGVRNPWRVSIDLGAAGGSRHGDIWIGDVGGNKHEEVNFIPYGEIDTATSRLKARNFGWRVWEGNVKRDTSSSQTTVTPDTKPVMALSRTDGRAVAGGVVYRGSAVPAMAGLYLYGDHATQKQWALAYDRSETTAATQAEITSRLALGDATSAWGQDASGEVYATSYNNGKIFKIVPKLAITTASFANAQVSVAASYALAASNAEGTVTWTRTAGNLPPGLAISGQNLQGTPSGAGSFSFTLTATDTQLSKVSRDFTLVVEPANAVTVTTSSLPAWTAGKSGYTATLAATGGSGTYSWAATGLPSGLSLSTGGVLSGTPSTASTTSVAITASDTSSPVKTGSRTLDIIINPAPGITTTSLPNAARGVAYATTLAATGGTGTRTFFANTGDLPAWLGVSGTGVLAGTPPTDASSLDVTVRVKDAVDAEASRTWTLTITAVPAFTSTPPTSANPGSTYVYDANATGNPAPTYSLPTKPSGMAIVAATGAITWNPAAGQVGSHSVVVRATNSAGTTDQSFTIVVTDYGLPARPAMTAYLNMPASYGDGSAVPTALAATGAFSTVSATTLTPATALIPYDINHPFWSDGALKSRWAAVPTGQTVGFTATGQWIWPAGSVLVKHFDIDTDETSATNPLKRLETRLLVVGSGGSTYGVTYRWRDDGTVTKVTAAETADLTITTSAGTRIQTWYYPSPGDCMQCHTPAASYVLGPNTRQLNKSRTWANGLTDNQIRSWRQAGLFNNPPAESAIPGLDKLVALDSTASLADKVRSYLDANCSQCHRPGGPITGGFTDARFDASATDRDHVMDTITNANLGGVPGARIAIAGLRLVTPKDSSRSALYLRAHTTAADIRMPPVGRLQIDTVGTTLLKDWIDSLPAVAPQVDALASLSGIVGIAVAPRTAVAAGSPSITWTASGLPVGLAIHPATGVISGTPTVSGLFTATITATNGAGPDSETLAIAVSPPMSRSITLQRLSGYDWQVLAPSDAVLTDSGTSAQVIHLDQTKDAQVAPIAKPTTDG